MTILETLYYPRLGCKAQLTTCPSWTLIANDPFQPTAINSLDCESCFSKKLESCPSWKKHKERVFSSTSSFVSSNEGSVSHRPLLITSGRF